MLADPNAFPIWSDDSRSTPADPLQVGLGWSNRYMPSTVTYPEK